MLVSEGELESPMGTNKHPAGPKCKKKDYILQERTYTGFLDGWGVGLAGIPFATPNSHLVSFPEEHKKTFEDFVSERQKKLCRNCP